MIKQGHNTLTITLPSKWVTDNNIKAGDEIYIDDSNKKCLKISSDLSTEKKFIEINISDLDCNSIRQKIRSTYKIGYDEILLNFNYAIVKELRTNRECPIMEIINHEVSNLIGCEIIKQDNNSCLIKDYAVDSELEFNNTLRRTFILIIDYGESLLEQAKNLNRESLKSMRERHFNIAKFIFYCQRLVNTGRLSENLNPTYMHNIISILDEILDIMKYTAADLIDFKGKKLQKQTINLFEKIIQQNKHFSNFYYKPDNKNLMILTENRWDVRIQLKSLIDKLPKNELHILTNLSHILELYFHLSEARMSLNYKILHP